ncbi:flagellin [Vibrio sp. EA2]|uniref:flagellin n=1 Tax=Vibrio sp. EA2 TaxID=3079860 RepID=UPI00294A42A9|nr:flagellin [Vibrio sp. EA2]MDV6252580.1 flagellin [Vibrio sp. EA2]
MPLSLHNNTAALATQRYIAKASDDFNSSILKLSSGKKINSAKDDAAGLQIANRLDVQSRGLDVAAKNVSDGVAIVQTAEASMQQLSGILEDMRDQSLQAANGATSITDRKAIQKNIQALKEEFHSIASSSNFAGMNLLDGTYGKKALQVGSNNETILLELKDMRSSTSEMGGTIFIAKEAKGEGWTVEGDSHKLGIDATDRAGNEVSINIEAKVGDDIEELATYINGQQELVTASVSGAGELQMFVNSSIAEGEVSFSGSLAREFNFDSGRKTIVENIDVTSTGGAQEAVSVIDSALSYVDGHRADMGALHNRFDRMLSNLTNMHENISASKGNRTDTDYAKETTEMTRAKILQQSSSSILAQARLIPNAALNLLNE